MKKSLLTPIASFAASALLVVVANAAMAYAAPAQADGQAVTIDNFAFAPAEISIAPGTSVTWTNAQSVRHTTTSDSGVWDSDIMTGGTSFSFTFSQAGDFAYHCDVHPDMTGVIHVLAVEQPAAEPAVDSATAAPAEAPVPEQQPAAPASSSYSY